MTMHPAPDTPAEILDPPDRPVTRGQITKQQRAAIQARHTARLQRDAQIIASVAGGMTMRAVAGQLGVSPQTVSTVWHAHLAREFLSADEKRAELELRFNTLLRAVWPKALGGTDQAKVSNQDQVRFVREARALLREIGLLNPGVYVTTASVEGEVNVTGTVAHEHRVVRTQSVLGTVAKIRAKQLTEGDGVDVAQNGHAPATNGHAAA